MKTIEEACGRLSAETGWSAAASGLRTGKSTLQALAIDLGYLDATFLRNEIRVSDDASRADVYLTLATGKNTVLTG